MASHGEVGKRQQAAVGAQVRAVGVVADALLQPTPRGLYQGALTHSGFMDALMPENFGLMLDPSTRVERAGRILLGGTPFRIVTLSDDQAAALAAWRRGEPVGDDEERRRFARALVASNLAQPCPPTAALTRDADTVVPVRDRPRQLRRVLQALTRLPDSDYVREVIVVDDASSDRDLTARIVEDGLGRLVRRAVWGGAPAARNSGAAATTAPFIAFLDSDCVPEDGWLAELLPHFADPSSGRSHHASSVSPSTARVGWPATRTSGLPWIAARRVLGSCRGAGCHSCPARPWSSAVRRWEPASTKRCAAARMLTTCGGSPSRAGTCATSQRGAFSTSTALRPARGCLAVPTTVERRLPWPVGITPLLDR